MFLKNLLIRYFAASIFIIALINCNLHAQTLIGDVVRLSSFETIPAVSEAFLVREGVPELTLFNSMSVDVEANYIQIEWLIYADNILDFLDFNFTDLDFGDEGFQIVDVNVAPSSTWGKFGFLSFTEDSVSWMNYFDSQVNVGDTLRLNIITRLIGDIDCDGEINFTDIPPFVDLLLSGQFDIKGDINGDGAVDLLDVSPFVDLL